MSVFGSTIRFAMAICLFLSAVPGQGSNAGTSPEASGAFRLSAGSSFSASSGAAGRRTRLAPPLNLISGDFAEALRIVEENYASNGTDGSRRFSSSVNRMLSELDPHSSYFSQKEFQALNDDHRGGYFGIGVTISDFIRYGRSGVYVLEVKKNSPADAAGLRFGDQIVKVDEVAVLDLDSDGIRDRLRGPLGTQVRLTVERWGLEQTLTFKVRRAKVDDPSIPVSFIAAEGVGYIALTEGFHVATAAEFDVAYRQLSDRGMKSLIVDLRGNGGGLMEQAIRIAEKFLPAGSVIVSQHGRRPTDERTWRSSNKRPESLPLVLLVNENTASASEIFAAAMQDNDRATIVGSRTFGKGLVQDIIPLDDGSGLVLTSERYYTPSGRSIQRNYSDVGLYDYFRHIDKSSLVGRSTFAAKTLKGRVVYGGDGIAPDIVVPTKQWSLQELAEHNTAFFQVRETADIVSRALSSYEKQFAAVRENDPVATAKAVLDSDVQFLAAMRSLLKSR